MPMYEYQCVQCGAIEEHYVQNSGQRDDALECAKCGGEMERIVSPFALGQSEYQMQAVLGSGAHLKGHFGKEAKRDRRQQRSQRYQRRKVSPRKKKRKR